MIVYVGAGSGPFRDFITSLGHGQMVSRQVGAFRKPKAGIWAFDNGAWTDFKNNVPFNSEEFMWRVGQLQELPDDRLPDWCVCPDALEQRQSIEFSLEWKSILSQTAPRLRWYLAVQDYMHPNDVIHATELEQFDGLFIGGSDPWREATAAGFIELGHQLGLPVHLARINGPRKLQWAVNLGADSVDGTGWVRAGERWVEHLINIPEPNVRLMPEDKVIREDWTSFGEFLLETYPTVESWRGRIPEDMAEDPHDVRYRRIDRMTPREFAYWLSISYPGFGGTEREFIQRGKSMSEEEFNDWKLGLVDEAERHFGPKPVPPELVVPQAGLNVCLVGCGKSKLGERAQAQDLYTGALFKKSRAYAEKNCNEWGILSAKHGLLFPDEPVGPYDVAMCHLSPGRRRKWCKNTHQQIVSRWGTDPVFTVLAGEPYLCAVEGLNAVYPLKGMQLGERLRWLNRELRK